MPDMFEFKGGVQTYSAFFLQAHQSLYPKSQYEIFAKHDTRVTSSFTYRPQTRFYLSGKIPTQIRTPAFAAALVGRGLWRRPNLILSTHLNFTGAAYWLKHFAQIPYWTVAHGIEAWNIQKPYLKTALSHADLILAVSNYTRNRLLQTQNLDPDKVVLLPNTFDDNQFKPAPKPVYLLQRYGLRPNQPIILTVARLAEAERYKGYDQILKALPQIRSVIPDIHYVLVGKGNDRARIEQLIAQLHLQDCVTLAGFVPDEQLCDHYNLCDVFAMPSKQEGFGIVYLEAMACGKPVVGGNQDGAIDALRQGELGALVDPDDENAIAQTLIQILQKRYPNPLLYQPEVLRQKTIEYFGFERFQDTLNHYLQHYFST
jgi:glycosyltransferase involved in cell wall biosynthesis